MQNVSSSVDASATGSAACVVQEFLSFRLGREEYGIDILKVQEIRSYEAPTRISNAPACVTGIINLRGVIVPIVDMRVKFQMEQVTCDALTVVIVLNLGSRVVGIVVDAVSDVVTLAAEQMLPVPDWSTDADDRYVLAVGQLDQRMLILLDIEMLMSSQDMGMVPVAHLQ